MKARVKIIFWTIPLLVIIFTLIFIYIRSNGLAVQWKFIGNPSENINKIIGVNFANRKLYVLTASGNTYSIYFNYPPDVISNPIRWNQEKYNNILVDPVEEFGGKMFKPPPPPFKLKQIYQFEIPTTESNNDTKFALSEDGNLWYWSFAFGAYEGLLYVLILAVEILLYLLALFINFAIFLTKRIIGTIFAL